MQKAIELCDDERRRADLHARPGDAARMCRTVTAFIVGDYDQASAWAERSFEFVGELKDPDSVCDVYAVAVLPTIARGRFREARRLAALRRAFATRAHC